MYNERTFPRGTVIHAVHEGKNMNTYSRAGSDSHKATSLGRIQILPKLEIEKLMICQYMCAMCAIFAMCYACWAPNDEIECFQLERSPPFDQFWSHILHFGAVLT